MFKDKLRVLVLGESGMVGGAIKRMLDGSNNPVGPELVRVPEVDENGHKANLMVRDDVLRLFKDRVPDIVIMCAGKVGGVLANSQDQSAFLHDNLMMGMNVMRVCGELKLPKLVYMASTCMYPVHSAGPSSSERIFSGPLEPTNEGYAIAKSAVTRYITLNRADNCRDDIVIVPTNVYGPGDRYGVGGHVMAAMIKRFRDAVKRREGVVRCWGSGKPLRQFIHCEDLAEITLIAATHYSSPEPLDAAVGEEISIADLAAKVAEVVGYRGEITWDESYPDGIYRKYVDPTSIDRLGFTPAYEDLTYGIRSALLDFEQRFGT